MTKKQTRIGTKTLTVESESGHPQDEKEILLVDEDKSRQVNPGGIDDLTPQEKLALTLQRKLWAKHGFSECPPDCTIEGESNAGS